jgi:ribosomal protein S18 acetylase RimI-like enzyme
MEYRHVTPEDYERVRQFLSEVGWQQRVADPEKFASMMKNTNRAVVALDGSKIVGFARALCDDISNGYISMVAVAQDRRRQGIGSELVRQLVKDDTGITWVLRAGRGSGAFWKKMGFESSEIAMEKLRS